MFKAGSRRTCLAEFQCHGWLKWPGAYPVFVQEAKGARFTDVDGNTYIDFCLGDTGSMTGHSPDATVAAIRGASG
jgi:glutamate-1-semialdehyde 2,1-aminomutase